AGGARCRTPRGPVPPARLHPGGARLLRIQRSAPGGAPRGPVRREGGGAEGPGDRAAGVALDRRGGLPRRTRPPVGAAYGPARRDRRRAGRNSDSSFPVPYTGVRGGTGGDRGMKVVSGEQMRAIEARLFDQYGFTSAVLMELAGRQVALIARRMMQ